MYNVTTWDPWKDLLSGFWVPAVDVEETAEEFVIQAELPGLKKEEIKLEAHGDLLVLSGERKTETEGKGRNVYWAERKAGKFQRLLQLPAEVDGTRAQATYEAGVLTVRLPKKEEAKPREIAIEVK